MGDAGYHGRGYGRGAVTGLLARIGKEYQHKKVYLSEYVDNKAAIRLYQEFGFHMTGEKDVHGEAVMKKR